MDTLQINTLAETVRPPPADSNAARRERSPQRSDSPQHSELDAISAALEAAGACARADQQQYGEHGAYAVATMYHALYLDQARDHLADWNAWLDEHARAESPARISLAPYQLHTSLREMVMALHYARHWAMLSAAYHHSRAAAEAFENITRAIQQIEQLSQDAGRAFLAASRE